MAQLLEDIMAGMLIIGLAALMLFVICVIIAVLPGPLLLRVFILIAFVLLSFIVGRVSLRRPR